MQPVSKRIALGRACQSIHIYIYIYMPPRKLINN
jgi:hypothetical protein